MCKWQVTWPLGDPPRKANTRWPWNGGRVRFSHPRPRPSLPAPQSQAFRASAAGASRAPGAEVPTWRYPNSLTSLGVTAYLSSALQHHTRPPRAPATLPDWPRSPGRLATPSRAHHQQRPARGRLKRLRPPQTLTAADTWPTRANPGLPAPIALEAGAWSARMRAHMREPGALRRPLSKQLGACAAWRPAAAVGGAANQGSGALA